MGFLGRLKSRLRLQGTNRQTFLRAGEPEVEGERGKEGREKRGSLN